MYVGRRYTVLVPRSYTYTNIINDKLQLGVAIYRTNFTLDTIWELVTPI